MSYNFFDPSAVNQLAKFQGTMAGVQAGNASVCGPAMAATSIFNQSGHYAIQDADTGMITIQKLGDESLYTKNWYDQGTDTLFDFSGKPAEGAQAQQEDGAEAQADNQAQGGSQITGQIGGFDFTPNEGVQTQQQIIYGEPSQINPTSLVYTTADKTADATYQDGFLQYPFGNGYVLSDNYEVEDDYTEEATSETEDAEADAKTLSASDLQDMVDAGIYESTDEALNASLKNGYTIEDSEQEKLGLYSDEDEKKIETMMSKFDLSRQEAIAQLGDKITSPETAKNVDELKEKLQEVQDKQGIFGKFWNNMKNFFGIGTSSDKVEETIEKYEKGEIEYDEAEALINEFEEKQEKGADIIKGTATVALSSLGMIAGGVPGLLIGAGIGGSVNSGLGLLDRSTNEVEGDEWSAENIKDFGKGALMGASANVLGAGARKIGGLKIIGKVIKKV